MKIAILGWGSLVWDPRNLEIDKTIGQSGWSNDGPILPIEFSRISQDGRLTLVIDPVGVEVQTLYSVSKFEELDHAVLDLAVREGCLKKRIGFFNKSDNSFHSKSTFIRANIVNWINEHEEFHALIWADLSKNFEEKIGLKLSEINVINYINYLPLEVRIKAEHYIRRAPSNVITPIRTAVEEELKWTKINLPTKE